MINYNANQFPSDFVCGVDRGPTKTPNKKKWEEILVRKGKLSS